MSCKVRVTIIYSAHVLWCGVAWRLKSLKLRQTEKWVLESTAETIAVWLSWIFKGNCFEKFPCCKRTNNSLLLIMWIHSLSARHVFCLPYAAANSQSFSSHTARSGFMPQQCTWISTRFKIFLLCVSTLDPELSKNKNKSFFHCFRNCIAQCRFK